MKKWQIENSEKLEKSEISEKLFRVFLLLAFKNIRRKFPKFHLLSLTFFICNVISIVLSSTRSVKAA